MIINTKSQLIRKDPDAGEDWRQEEKAMTEDEMVGFHHRLNGHEFEQALRDGEGQESLVRCSPWGSKKVEQGWTTEQQQLEYNCFTMLCYFLLYNSVNQPCVCVCALPLDHPPGPAPHPSEDRAEPPVPHNSLLLALYSTQSVCVCVYIPPYPPLPESTCPFSASESLLLPCKLVHLCQFSGFHKYALLYDTCFFSLWLTSLCMEDSCSIHISTNNTIPLLVYGWVIFLGFLTFLFTALETLFPAVSLYE